jgi:integrase
MRLDKWRSSRQNHHSARVGKGRKQIAGSTLNRDLAALQAALSRAVEWGMLAANPVKRSKRSTEDESAVVRYLSVEEEQRLLAALSERDEARRSARRSANEWRIQRGYDVWPEYGKHTDYLTPLVNLALHTALRRGELFQLRWRDIDLDRSLLTVRGSGAKSGQTRHVPLNSAAVQVVSSCKTARAREQSYVFG